MMNYRYDKKKKSKRQRSFIFAGIIIILLFTPILTRVYDIFETPITRAYTNIEETSHILNTLVDSTQFSKKELLTYNQVLKNKIQQLEAEKEYIQLYTQRDTNTVQGSPLIYADIINRAVLSDSRFTINKGVGDGIAIGDVVMASDYMLVGEIVDVFDHTSRVAIYTEVGQLHEGILFPYDIPVTLEGDGGVQYVMNLDRAVPVEIGDIVYQSEMPGYSMATVRNIQFDPRDPFKKVILSPRVNIHELTYVQVMKKTTNNS